MEVNLMNKKSKNIDELESYTIADIEVLLNCNVRIAKKIKLEIMCEQLKQGVEIENTKTYKIEHDLLFEYIKKHYKDKLPTKKETVIIDHQYIESKSEILEKVFVTVRDIRILLNCSVHVATKIIADVRKIMIDKGMIPLMTTVLTKYLILYLEDNNIDY